MKGPFERLKYEPRRLWECPVCNHRERAPGDVTTRLCPCQAKAEPLNRRYMRLVEEGYRRVAVPPPPAPTAVELVSTSDEPTLPASTDSSPADAAAPS